MINVKHWKSFTCSDLFECKNTGNILARDIEDGSGITPYVTASAYNNGVVAHIDASKYDIIKGNCILVGGKTFTITYQKEDFVSNDSHNFVIRVKNKEISELEYLYLVTVIYNYFGQKYSWNDAVTKDKFLGESIPLPSTVNNQVDWQNMGNYMKYIIEESEKTLTDMNKISNCNSIINISNWKKFHLYDDFLFDIDMGTKLDKSKMKETNPTINFIGRANANNGITTVVDEIEGVVPYKAGYMTLSLGGEYLGSCFIQPKPFYTSQNVIVLIPNEKMTDNIKRFIATMIFKESRLHYKAFVDELNKHIKTDFEIYLPSLEDGSPDWQYMENYMQAIMQNSEGIISALNL